MKKLILIILSILVLVSFASAITTPIMHNATLIGDRGYSIISINNLTGYCNGTGNYTNLTFYEYIIYENDVITVQANTTLNYTANVSVNIYNVSYINTTLADEFILSCRAWDSTNLVSSNWSNSSTITIGDFGLDDCSSYSAKALNYSIRHEDNGTPVVGDLDAYFSYYTVGNTSDAKSYSKSESGSSSYDFCIYPEWHSLQVNYNVTADATSYSERSKTETGYTISNSTANIIMYLLPTEGGIYISFRTIDQNENAIIGATVVMKLTDSGAIVDEATTDGTGMATFIAVQDTSYTFTFSKSGYTSQSAIISPQSEEIYYIIMSSGTADDFTIHSLSTGISYDFYPETSPLLNNTNYTFTFNLTSEYWNITACTLYLKNDTTVLTSSSGAWNTSNCDIAILYNTNNWSQIISHGTITINNTAIDYTRTYQIMNTYTADFTLQYLINDLNEFSRAGFNANTRLLLAFIIIFAITGIAAMKFGFINPEASILLLLSLVLFFSYAGWLTINLMTIPTAFLRQYMIFILMLLMGGGYIIWRHQ